MALVLSIREGDDFFVKQERYIIARLTGPSSYELLRDRDQKLFKIDSEMMVEIDPDVMVSSACSEIYAKVVIDAPREFPIVRGSPAPRPPRRSKGRAEWA